MSPTTGGGVEGIGCTVCMYCILCCIVVLVLCGTYCVLNGISSRVCIVIHCDVVLPVDRVNR